MKNRASLWGVLAILAMVIAGHAVMLYYVSSHTAMSMAVIAIVLAVVLAKHVGLIGSLYALLRKSLRRSGTE